jgi:plasmid stabilization system protein ParE
MKKYSVFLSKEAQDDIEELADFITNALQSPLTSKRYAEGIVKELVHLEKYAGSIRVTNQKTFSVFGTQLRRVNYKSHSIIYSIRKNVVVVHRIVLQSSIKD